MDAAERERATRYRGLRFPPDAAVLPPDAAARLAKGEWQPTYTAAAFALARSDDHAVVAGAGCGHLAAVLAGKLGLPRVTVLEPSAVRRAYLARLARENGLARLAIGAEGALPALAPTLLFADLEGAVTPEGLADCPDLRAVALHLPPAPAPDAIPFAALAAAGLSYRTDLSSGATLVFSRAGDAR